VFADDMLVAGEEHGYATVNDDGEVVWKVDFEPNLTVAPSNTVFGSWKLGESPFGETNYVKKEFHLTGKCLRTKIRIANTEPKENHIIGFAYIFKSKRP
jgi:hypothetical protein